jgi:hypothetical protein
MQPDIVGSWCPPYLYSPPSATNSLRCQLIDRPSSRHSSSILPQVRRITLSSQLSETSDIAIAMTRFLNIPRVNILLTMRTASHDAKLVAFINVSSSRPSARRKHVRSGTTSIGWGSIPALDILPRRSRGTAMRNGRTAVGAVGRNHGADAGKG